MNIWVDQAEIVEELQDLGIDTTTWEASSYTKLNKEILRAQREFERLTRRKFEEATITEKINGSGKESLVLTYYPIVSITSIIIKDIPQYQQALQLSEYRLEAETGRIYLVSTQPFLIATFPTGYLNVEATYVYGYSIVNIPLDIKDAISYMVQMRVIFRTPADWEKSGLKSIRIAQYAEGYQGAGSGKVPGGIFGSQKQNWEKHIKETISRYKRMIIV